MSQSTGGVHEASRPLCRFFLAVLVISAIAASSVRAQSSPFPFDEVLATTAFPTAVPSEPSVTAAQIVTRGRPTVMVMVFESGTVAAQAEKRGGLRGLFDGRSEAVRYEPSQLGIGITDMLTEKRLETGEFTVMERKPLEPGSGVQSSSKAR